MELVKDYVMGVGQAFDVRGLLFEAEAGVYALTCICVLFYLAILHIVCFKIVSCWSD